MMTMRINNAGETKLKEVQVPIFVRLMDEGDLVMVIHLRFPTLP